LDFALVYSEDHPRPPPVVAPRSLSIGVVFLSEVGPGDGRFTQTLNGELFYFFSSCAMFSHPRIFLPTFLSGKCSPCFPRHDAVYIGTLHLFSSFTMFPPFPSFFLRVPPLVIYPFLWGSVGPECLIPPDFLPPPPVPPPFSLLDFFSPSYTEPSCCFSHPFNSRQSTFG